MIEHDVRYCVQYLFNRTKLRVEFGDSLLIEVFPEQGSESFFMSRANLKDTVLDHYVYWCRDHTCWKGNLKAL